MRQPQLIQSFQMRTFGSCDGPGGAYPGMLQEMEEKLQKEFEPTHCKIVDPYGDMNAITIHIHSAKFKGMLPVARHRAVNTVLKEELKMIHACQIDAKAV